MANLLDFRKNNAAGSLATDDGRSQAAQIVLLDILEVDTSHVNPRHTKGDNYESIKQSIRNIGLQSMLTVTRVPGKERYSLYNGGNTRLTILKELYDEYLDAGETEKAERLRHQQCRFVPYTDDLDSLIKQVAENDERSPMTLIDKARAVFQIREMYLKHYKVDDVSDSKLVKYIHSLGWTSINRQSVLELSFAFDALESVIPLALDAGMGRPKIQQLRLWLGYTEKWLAWLVKEYGYPYSVEQGRELFFQVLASYDSEEAPIDLNAFYTDFHYRLSDILMTFDRRWNAEIIRFELSIVEETGEVGQVKPTEELQQKLAETSSVPPPTFPEPRKPRTPRQSPQTETTASDTGHHQDASATDVPAALAVEPVGEDVHTTEKQAEEAKETNEFIANLLAQQKNVLHRYPPLKVPDRSLPTEAYKRAVRERCAELINIVIQQIPGNRQILGELLTLDGDTQRISTYTDAPFFFIRLDNEEDYRRVHEGITQATPGGQMAVLFCIYLLSFYLSHAFSIEETEENRSLITSRDNLIRIWHDFVLRYTELQMSCLTGLSAIEYGDDTNVFDDLIVAERFIHEYWGLIYSLETYPGGQ